MKLAPDRPDRLAKGELCPGCGSDLTLPDGGSRVIGVEYAYGDPNRYDGVSEWRCPDCGYREGRWTGRHLADQEAEPRFGERRNR